MGHHGDPEEEEEVIVVEEPSGPTEGPAKIVKVPRVPTQADIDAHVATHLPHADFCDVCARGRGRNAPHRQNKRTDRCPEGADSGAGSVPEGEAGSITVPRVCMDYFYVSNRKR